MKRPRFLLCLLPLFALASCIYDFHPEWQGQEGFVAIEGDIRVGDTCRFDVRLSTQLDNPQNVGSPLTYSLRVEAGDGTVYPLRDSIVDLTKADISQEYRLVVDVTAPFRRTYASSWEPVHISPPIDSLSWSIEDGGSKLWVNLSTHSDSDSGFYRWTALETWEYHATYYAEYFFAPAGTVYKGQTVEQDTFLENMDGDNTYYCWRSVPRDDILLGSTQDLSKDRLVDFHLFAFAPEDKRISYVYSVDLIQTRLTEAAYRYWETLNRNSSDVGGLFSAEPVELRGNLVNVDDPDELVLGYVSVTTCSRWRMFIKNSDTRFSRWHGPSYGFVTPFPDEYRKYYGWGYRVGWMEEGDFVWLPGECVDCRRAGGTKDRPSWWINNDK